MNAAGLTIPLEAANKGVQAIYITGSSVDIRYRQPFVLRAQTWTSNMLGLQLAFAAAVYRQARD